MSDAPETANWALAFANEDRRQRDAAEQADIDAMNARVKRLADKLRDHERLKFVKELWDLHTERGGGHMDQTLYEYERRAKERIGT